MTAQDVTQQAPGQRRHAFLVFQVAGLFDIALGLAIAVFGPGFLGLDFFTCGLLGGGLAILGILTLLFGRWRFGPKAADRRTASTVTRNR